MNDFSTLTAQEGKDGSDNASEEGSSPQRYENSRSQTSFWGRALRLLRPSQGERLREDLADALMTDANVSSAFSPEERAMLHNILRFREVRVEDIMVPRADIEAVDMTMTLGELMIYFEETGRSRMPVYCEAGLIRKILFVPPSMLASDLMQSMQAARTQMALVIDEYGGTDGLASHEDIVEMVIGDVEDEHDDEEVMFSQVGEDIFVADARVELEEISAAIGSDFDIRDQLDDVDTLGGLIFSALGRIPVRGEVVQAVPGFEFHILEADPRRIKRVRVVRKRTLARRRHVKGEPEYIPPEANTAATVPVPAAAGEQRH